MRDAIGSTFMFRIIIIFIVFFVTFATIAVSYAKVFQLKNKAIDYIEQNQFNVSTISKITDSVSKFDDMLAKNSYHHTRSDFSVWRMIESKCTEHTQTFDRNRKPILTNNGACIVPVEYTVSGKKHYYINVTLYLVIKMPIIQRFPIVIPISGNTDDYSSKYFVNSD